MLEFCQKYLFTHKFYPVIGRKKNAPRQSFSDLDASFKMLFLFSVFIIKSILRYTGESRRIAVCLKPYPGSRIKPVKSIKSIISVHR